MVQKGGDQEGPDRSVIGARWGWGDGMCWHAERRD